jgi:hypothetical protein
LGLDIGETVEHRVAATLRGPAEARHLLCEQIGNALPEERIDDGVLAVSELVSFGLRKGLVPQDTKAAFLLRLRHSDGCFRVEIGSEPVADWHALQDSLFELVVMNVVTDAWDIASDGSAVWFTIGTSYEGLRCPKCGLGVVTDIAFDAGQQPDEPSQDPNARQLVTYSCGHQVLGPTLATADAEQLAVERRAAEDTVDPPPDDASSEDSGV